MADLFEKKRTVPSRPVRAPSRRGERAGERIRVPPSVRQALRTPGSPLPSSTREVMESRFGHRFADVRVHGDEQATESARTLDAQAYTIGRDVVFAPGAYAPQTPEGQALIAHELAHVVEQRTPSAGPQSEGPVLQLKPKKEEKPKGTTTINKTKRASYATKGTTLAEVAASIAGRPEAGETVWNPHLDYKTDAEGKVANATVTVDVQVTMPQWAGAAKLSKDAKAEWDRWLGALEEHEQGHVSLVRDTLQGLGESLVGQSEDDAKTAFSDALDQLQAKSDAFDVETGHGRKRGTILDTTIK